MKITFIRPNMTSSRSPSAVQPLAFAVLSALTPPDIEVELFDECIEKIPEDITTDLAAMTVHTFTALPAYRIADRLRENGITVVMGGYHPTFMPQEALQHADCVVVGEAEKVWGRLISDFRNGCLEKTYHGPASQNLDNIIYARSLFEGKKYAPFVPVEFNRGCRFSCDFCAISSFNHNRFKSRPVMNVIREIEALDSKYITIIDDNIFSDVMNAQQLFKELIPLKKKWGCQISIDVARDDRMLELLARSGCVAMIIGLESLDKKNLKLMNKTPNIAQSDYAAIIRKVKSYGIMVWGSFLFGYDHDTVESIEAAVDFAVRNKFFLTNFNSLIPMPGTRLYVRLKAEGRLFNENWWLDEKQNKYGQIVFRPTNMSAADLQGQCIGARLKFNSLSNIFKRLFDFKANARNIGNAFLFLIVNLIARREIIQKMSIIPQEP